MCGLKGVAVAVVLLFGAAHEAATPEGSQLDLHGGWHSQYGQDRLIMKWLFSSAAGDDAWAARESKSRSRQGVFVELGAGDGATLSNSLAFEEKLGWTGLLIEPVSVLFEKLQRNRPKAKCVNACVSGRAGYRLFAEDGLNSGMSDRNLRESDDDVQLVHCRSLGDLIDQHLGAAGSHIDYLSLDTEGTELEILRAFDFQRHVVDVMSIEVHDSLPPETYARLSALLARKGFRFLERLVVDEIWVRQRGQWPDPSCVHPSLLLAEPSQDGPAKGWGQLRQTLFKLLEHLEKETTGDLDADKVLTSLAKDGQGIFSAIESWNSGDLRNWESQCPAGMLALAMAFALLIDRNQGAYRTAHGLANELRKQFVLQWNERLSSLFATFSHRDEVEAAERAGTGFEIKFPMGRNWHEISFIEILESRWPFFSMLDLAAKIVVSMGHVVDNVEMKAGTIELRPIRVPRIRCHLQVPDEEGSTQPPYLMLPRPRPTYASKRKGSHELLHNADACSLLGLAAGHFHAALSEVRRLLASQPRDLERYDALANWTAACAGRGPVTTSDCSSSSFEDCAAINDKNQPVPRECLRRATRGSRVGLRLRRRLRLDESTDYTPALAQVARVAQWISEGERLFREFVERHGFYQAIWAAGRPELSGGRDSEQSEQDRWPTEEELMRRQTMFSVLHSLQKELFFVADPVFG